MITDARLKQLMQQVGMPNSIGLYQALRQCDMEATLAERERCAAICDNNACDYTREGAEACARSIRAS